MGLCISTHGITLVWTGDEGLSDCLTWSITQAPAGCTFDGPTKSLAHSRNVSTVSRWRDHLMAVQCRRGKQSNGFAPFKTITIERHWDLTRTETKNLIRLFPR